MMTCDVIQIAFFMRRHAFNKVIETRKAVQCKIFFWNNFQTEIGHSAYWIICWEKLITLVPLISVSVVGGPALHGLLQTLTLCIFIHDDSSIHKVKSRQWLGAADFYCVRLVSHYLNDILCKNYNYIFLFVQVMPKIIVVPFFFRTRCRWTFQMTKHYIVKVLTVHKNVTVCNYFGKMNHVKYSSQ